MHSDLQVHIFIGILIASCFLFDYGICLRCFSCNSKNDKHCADPFVTNYTSVSTDIVDCSDEVSTREFVAYFSNLMNALGVPVSLDPKYTSKIKDTNKPSACQKVEINDDGKQVVIRDCALLSDIVCDSLRNYYDSDLSISYCDVCNTDYCNNSDKFVITWNLLTIIVLTNIII